MSAPGGRRILLLITDLQIGGTPSVVRELAIRLNAPDRGVTVEVACLAEAGPVSAQLADAGAVAHALGARGPTDLLAIARLYRLIAQRQFDTVFSFLVHANAAAALVSPFCGGVRFLQSIQTTQPRPRWHWPVQAVAQLLAERIVVPSESVARAAQSRALVAAEKIVVISNALEPSEFSFVPCRLLATPWRVGFLGRLDPVKRVGDLIAAMRRIPNAQLDIYGDGNERYRLEALIAADPSLRSRVVLRGAVKRPQEALEQMDVLVLPSEAEGFGLVLIEAMASGVPVVASDVDGIRDVVQDGLTGLLVPPASPERLATAILKVLQDEALRMGLVERGHAEVIRRFSWPAVLKQYRRLLELED